MTSDQKEQVEALRLAFAMERRTAYLGRDDEVAEELRRLHSKVETLQDDKNNLSLQVLSLISKETDAERYQWLRRQDWIDDAIMFLYGIDHLRPSTLDDAIDKSRADCGAG